MVCGLTTDKDAYILGETITITYTDAPTGSVLQIGENSPIGVHNSGTIGYYLGISEEETLTITLHNGDCTVEKVVSISEPPTGLYQVAFREWREGKAYIDATIYLLPRGYAGRNYQLGVFYPYPAGGKVADNGWNKISSLPATLSVAVEGSKIDYGNTDVKVGLHDSVQGWIYTTKLFIPSIPPECEEGTHETIENCWDGSEKRWRDCVNGKWQYDERTCPTPPAGPHLVITKAELSHARVDLWEENFSLAVKVKNVGDEGMHYGIGIYFDGNCAEDYRVRQWSVMIMPGQEQGWIFNFNYPDMLGLGLGEHNLRVVTGSLGSEGDCWVSSIHDERTIPFEVTHDAGTGEYPITFTSTPDTTNVFVNGTYMRTTPCRIWLDAGTYEITCKKPRYGIDIFSITVGAGEPLSYHRVLTPVTTDMCIVRLFTYDKETRQAIDSIASGETVWIGLTVGNCGEAASTAWAKLCLNDELIAEKKIPLLNSREQYDWWDEISITPPDGIYTIKAEVGPEGEPITDAKTITLQVGPCPEGAHETLEMCSDGVTEKRWRDCVNGKWVEGSQTCPGVPPECEEGVHETLEFCPDGVTEKRWRDCVNGKWVEGSQTCPGVTPEPIGDITKVTLDDKLLPESGTLGWLLNDEAAVKVFFRNTGNVASAFHIWLTDENGAILCDVTTESVPADGAERYVVCGTFTPDVIETKTLTAHITP